MRGDEDKSTWDAGVSAPPASAVQVKGCERGKKQDAELRVEGCQRCEG